MLNILIKLMFMCALSLSLNANNYITSLFPQKDAINVQSDIKIQITFNNHIVTSSTNTITLKTDNKNIKGEMSVKDTNTLIFTPIENLKIGIYSLHVNTIKLINPEPIKPKTWFQKLIYKICSFFYSDVKKCKLYILLFGNNDITTTSINYSFSVNDNIVTIETLTLKTLQTELKENTQTTLTLKATYSDSTIKDITKNIQWTIQDNSIVTINNNTLEALKEGTTTLSAKVDNTTSNTITITVYKEINGYKLPPEPDQTINDSTLLGIDSNNNGVRDDVEIYVINRFKNEPKFPKTKTAIAMQYAWADQKLIENPTMETDVYESDAIACESYSLKKQVIHANISGFEAGLYRSKHRVYTTAMKDKIYNTRERIEQLFAASGQILTIGKRSIERCRTNIDELGE